MQNQEFIIESGVLMKYNGCEPHVEIPHGVTAVGKWAFAYNKNLSSITVPDGVTVIYQGAFQYCTLLTEVSLPESLVHIEGYAFQHCESLERLDLPTGLKELGMYAFEYCKKLRHIALPQNVTAVEKSTFAHCDLLESVRFCGALTNIDAWAFSYCSRLRDVIFDNIDGTMTLNETAFASSYRIRLSVPGVGAWCENVDRPFFDTWRALHEATVFDGLWVNGVRAEQVSLDEGTKHISRGAFAFISGISAVTACEGLDSVGECAFLGSPVRSVVLPDGVRKIGREAFSNCTALSSVTLSAGLEIIEKSAFSTCSALTHVSIPSTVKHIGKFAFCSCRSLTSIELPPTLESIGDYAFATCDVLSNIKLPSECKLGKDLFDRSPLVPRDALVTATRCYTISPDEEGILTVDGIGTFSPSFIDDPTRVLLDAACGAWRLKIYGTYWDEGENGPAGHYDDYESYHYFKPEDCILHGGQVIGFVYGLVDKTCFLIKDYENVTPRSIPYYREDVRLYHLEQRTN